MITVGLCLTLTWLVVRNAALDLFTDRGSTIPLQFIPAGSSALAANAWSRVVAAGGDVDPTSRRLASEALRREPVNASALALIGLAASADGRLDRARLLMEAARDRDPRLPSARYWLLDHDIRSGDYAAGLDEVGPALRLRPGTADAIMALVMGLLDVPGGPTSVRAKLATNPFWRADFFQTQAYRPGHAGPLLALLQSLPPASAPSDGLREQRAVLSAALIDGNPADAYRLWLSLTPHADPGSPDAVYDADFRGLAGAPPFNWALTKNSDVSTTMLRVADLPEGHALALSYRGTTPTLIAEQYRLAEAGRYRFQFRARRIGAGNFGQLVARLRCAISDRELVAVIADAGPTIGTYQAEFDLPISCPSLRITFMGEPGDRPGSMEMQVTGVQLTRIQAADEQPSFH
jgi:hypothetical protein